MWQQNEKYDPVYQQIKAVRGVANPNIGFTCQVGLRIQQTKMKLQEHQLEASAGASIERLQIGPYGPG